MEILFDLWFVNLIDLIVNFILMLLLLRILCNHRLVII